MVAQACDSLTQKMEAKGRGVRSLAGTLCAITPDSDDGFLSSSIQVSLFTF